VSPSFTSAHSSVNDVIDDVKGFLEAGALRNEGPGIGGRGMSPVRLAVDRATVSAARYSHGCRSSG